MPRRDIATTFLRWASMRAISVRGYWIVTSLYLVIDADLSAFQLVFLGTAMELTVLVSEIPTGVMADTISRHGRRVTRGRCRLDGDPGRQRDLGQPTGDQRLARHRAVVPGSGRIDG